MYQYIVFDLDMTILNTWEANLCAVKEALEKLEGKIVEKKDLEHIFGCTTNQTMENFGVKDKRAFIQEWYDGVVRYQHTISFFEGIKELLYELKESGYGLGIVTSRTKAEAQVDVERFQMDGIFNQIIGADDVLMPKPHPDPLNKFIEENKTQKEKVIYVGDAISDLKCALRAGVDFAAAGWGIQSNHDFSESTYYFNHPSELRKCLLGL